MRGKKIGWLFSGASMFGAFLGVFLTSRRLNIEAYQAAERITLVGSIFAIMFVCGFLGLHLTMMLSRTYKVERKPMGLVAFVLVAILLFGIGAGGQYLFMYSKEEVTRPAEVDMVLLLDASSSMLGNTDSRTDAACQFVDSLSEDCRLQTIAFAGTVLDSTQLLTMNSTNKTTVKQMITAIDASGMTDFNEPLQQAMDTLNNQGRQNCNKAVVLLTDGQSDLDSNLVKNYESSDIQVFTIRISRETYLDGDARALVDLANNTGGFDTQLIPQTDGSIQTGDMLKAFQEAFKATSETKVNMRKDLIVYAKDGITFVQFLIRDRKSVV